MEPNERFNANNNVHGNGTLDRGIHTVSKVVWRALRQTLQIILRLYIIALTTTYQWCALLLSQAMKPLQPALDQVRKVPRQDISVQGIIYQWLRLIFLIVLYFSPWGMRAVEHALAPLKNLRDRLLAYAWDVRGEGEEQRTEEKNSSVEKDLDAGAKLMD